MVAVRFNGVSKHFNRHRGAQLLRHRLARLLRPAGPMEPFYALSDVSFEVQPGESLAIVGPNGAGKSTLLNITTGLCLPDSGTVEINGRVAPLLELNSGFHPDLTGAENVRIKAALQGLNRRQARERFEEIVDFSGVREAINEPLRTYSSGMILRLAFSVAAISDPDILIVDEVLGVGDREFSVKSAGRIQELRKAGKTMICVSHSLESLAELCDRGLYLERGSVKCQGKLEDVLNAYRQNARPVRFRTAPEKVPNRPARPGPENPRPQEPGLPA